MVHVTRCTLSLLVIAILGCAALCVSAQSEESAAGSIDGQIKIHIQQASKKAHARGKKILKEAQKGGGRKNDGKRRGPRPIPFLKNDDLPCNEGGGDCSDYEDDCNTYRCNRAKRYCRSTPKIVASCDSFYAGQCNQGPGKCLPYTSGGSIYGMCFGTPKLGGSCDDYNECTDDDTCKLGRDGVAEVGVCEGHFNVGKSCDDGDECTIKDKCTVESNGGGPDYIFCEGTPKAGLSCNDYNECTDNDKCQVGDDYTFCEGTKKAEGASCDANDDCEKNGKCKVYESDYGDYIYCEGDPAPGNDCDDYTSCTTEDTCVLGDSGDYAFCRGTPKPEGTPCDDYGYDGTCQVDGPYAYCSE